MLKRMGRLSLVERRFEHKTMCMSREWKNERDDGRETMSRDRDSNENSLTMIELLFPPLAAWA